MTTPQGRIPRARVIASRMRAHEKKGGRRSRALDELQRRGVLDRDFADYLRRAKFSLHDYGRTLHYYAKIHRHFLRFGSGLRGKRLLHLGSSTGLYMQFLQSLGVKAVGIDFDSRAVQVARKIGNRRVVRGDIRFLFPFQSGTMDYVLSDHLLLAHYGDIRGYEWDIFRQAFRVLKPGGILVVAAISKRDIPLFHEINEQVGFRVLKKPAPRGEIVLQKME